MKRLRRLACVACVCVTGCQLVWSPDEYRADLDDGGVDATVDAPIDATADVPVDASDTGVDATDASALDTGTDVMADVDLGCLTDRLFGPITLNGGPGEAGLANVRVDYDGAGAAITIAGPGVSLDNVWVVLTGSGTGIAISDAGDDAVISDVRVSYEGPASPHAGMFAHQIGLYARSTSAVEPRIGNLTVRNFVTERLEGIRFEGVERSELTGIRILNPLAGGDRDTDPDNRYAGFAVFRSESVTVEDFTIESEPSEGGAIDHALHVSDVAACSFTKGYISAVSSLYPVRLEGSTRPSTMDEVEVHQSRAGIEAVGTANWTLTTMEVARRSDCASGDFSYANRTSGGFACVDCFITPSDCMNESVALAAATAGPGDGIIPRGDVVSCF